MDEATRQERLRALPSIDELLARPVVASLVAHHARPIVVDAVREAVASARARILSGEDVRFDDRAIGETLERLSGPRLKRVINATGVVLHTNLGRAPLAPLAIERMSRIAAGYSNLEFDLDEGERGSRYAPVVGLLQRLIGAEDALVVNNCASAVWLTLSALAAGREAIVSRGEAVEIGGGFRIPDVMRQSGAQMVEVGTTNRTRLADYQAAIDPGGRTALIVKVHRSNFAVVGFSEEVEVRELRGLTPPVYVDLGSGLLTPLHGEGLGGEPTVASVIAGGAAVVSFSGDKLLGGPQAGIIVGRRDLLAKLKQHPLNRVLRVDKLTVAALEATLELYRDGREAEIPVRAALSVPLAELQARAKRLSALLPGVRHRVVATTSKVGGGTLPLAELPSAAVAIESGGAGLHDKLRATNPPVIGRIVDDEVWLDVRCVAETELEALGAAVRGAV
ncbi:MAG: L-seryl-tRNA(Sec) selenium transferase [Myxococcaceae bacterium]